MALTGDGHVHTEWSWDVGLGRPHGEAAGRMEDMCRRAVQIGLPALAFTEHLDVTDWAIEPGDLPDRLRPLVTGGVLSPPPFDADGYLESVARCRYSFPELRLLTGVEWGQPHLAEANARQVIDLDALDRVNGSLHTIPLTDEPGSARSEPYTLYRLWPADQVIRNYLAEVPRMLAGSAIFTVFCHIEYAVRYWPTEGEGPFDPKRFEDEFRQAMAAIAGTGRALELNIGGPIRPWIPQWWREVGGRALTIASDAHAPDVLAGNFYEAMAMAEHFGFRPGRRPEDFWTL
jgi:histidinol-phosphatase (PHP family)